MFQSLALIFNQGSLTVTRIIWCVEKAELTDENPIHLQTDMILTDDSYFHLQFYSSHCHSFPLRPFHCYIYISKSQLIIFVFVEHVL